MPRTRYDIALGKPKIFEPFSFEQGLHTYSQSMTLSMNISAEAINIPAGDLMVMICTEFQKRLKDFDGRTLSLHEIRDRLEMKGEDDGSVTITWRRPETMHVNSQRTSPITFTTGYLDAGIASSR